MFNEKLKAFRIILASGSPRRQELLRELASLRGGEVVGDDKDSTPFDKVKDYIKKNLR